MNDILKGKALFIDFDNVTLGDDLDLYLNKPQYFQKYISLNYTNDQQTDYNAPINLEIEIIPEILSNQEYAIANEEIELAVSLVNLSTGVYNNLSITITDLSNGVMNDNSLTENILTLDSFSSYTTGLLFSGIVNDISKGNTIDFLVTIYIDDESFEYLISILVGPLSTSDPIPPDNYGYWTYDNTDLDYEKHPIYNWIELNPQNGGNGMNLGLTDDTVTNIDLEFSFRYYGNDYNSISICSNGWPKDELTLLLPFKDFRIISLSLFKLSSAYFIG